MFSLTMLSSTALLRLLLPIPSPCSTSTCVHHVYTAWLRVASVHALMPGGLPSAKRRTASRFLAVNQASSTLLMVVTALVPFVKASK